MHMKNDSRKGWGKRGRGGTAQEAQANLHILQQIDNKLQCDIQLSWVEVRGCRGWRGENVLVGQRWKLIKWYWWIAHGNEMENRPPFRMELAAAVANLKPEPGQISCNIVNMAIVAARRWWWKISVRGLPSDACEALPHCKISGHRHCQPSTERGRERGRWNLRKLSKINEIVLQSATSRCGLPHCSLARVA